MNDKFKLLANLGAGEFEHLDGSLINHLNGTRNLLNYWNASEVLQDAGLYHAVYGTAGFEEQLVSTNNREKIKNIIGGDAEEIVYQYCACDRNYVWPQIGIETKVEFKNRFTGKTYLFDEKKLRTFCELSVANELDIAKENDKFIASHGKILQKYFTNMGSHLSQGAIASIPKVLSPRS